VTSLLAAGADPNYALPNGIKTLSVAASFRSLPSDRTVGWYTTEYETDQLASMYVNARVLANFYRQVRDRARATCTTSLGAKKPFCWIDL